MRLGILSDTHNLLRGEVLSVLEGVDCILHAGDICRPDILEKLETIAPVYAVRGNADKDDMGFLPEYMDQHLQDLHVFICHKKKDLPQDLSAFDFVIFGHSHQYTENRQGNTLILNPGSCGPRRFHQAITMAVADVCGKEIRVTRIEIAHEEKKAVPPQDMRLVIERVVREYVKGKTQDEIAVKNGFQKEIVELIIRLYVTHPGVTTEGIMTKMGL